MAELENNVLIALTKKRGGKKYLAPSMEGYETGYNIDGIYIKEGDASRIFALGDITAAYGIASQDLPDTDPNYGKVSPSVGGMDGEESSQCIIDIYQLTEGAVISAKEYGWLPSAGEMDMVAKNIDAVNALLEAAGGTKISDGRYWLSQRRNASYPWFFDAAEKVYGAWVGGSTQLLARPCKSAADWESNE